MTTLDSRFQAQAEFRARLAMALSRKELQLQPVLAEIANQILGEFADIVSIALVDESGEAMDQVVVRHRDRIADADMARLGQIKIVRGHGLSGKVWQSGQPLWLNDLDAAPAQQEGWLPEAQPFVDHYGVRSLLYLPLRSHGEITGGLSLTRVSPHGNFTPDEVALFTDVAEICGLAITNARLHAQLAAREAEFRVLAENASDVVFRADQDRRLTWISPTVTDVLGWTPEELLGTRMSDLWRPEAWAATEADRAAVYAGQAPLASGGYLFELRTKSGEYRWMSGRAKPVTDDAGNPSGAVAGVRDVDELVTAREALRKSTEQYRLLAENAADVVVRTAGDSKREWVSDSVQAVLGWTPQEFLSLSDEQLLHPDDLADLMRRRAALHARSGPEVSHSEFRVRAADGRMMWLSSRTRRLADGSRITALRVINREVEMRAALQQSNRDLEAFASAVAASEERFRTAFDGAPIGAAIEELNPCPGHFLDVNEAYTDISGYTRGQLLDMTALDITHPDDRAGWAQGIHDLAAHKVDSYHQDRRFTHANGHTIWVRAHASAIGTDAARRQRAVVYVEDITERRDAEERLRAALKELEQRTGDLTRSNDELKRSNRNLQQFAHVAATVADVKSLKSTLNTIAGVVVEATDAGACAIVLVDGQPPQAHVAGLAGLPDDYPQAYAAAFRRGGRRLPTLLAYETGQPVLLTDTRACAELDGLADQSWPQLACFPLMARGVPVGAIKMLHARGPHLDDAQVRFLQTVADQVAVAVNAARLAAEAGEALVVGERQRLARELHDSVSQSLFSMTLLARASSLRLQRPSLDDAGELQEMLTDLEDLSTSALTEMRALLYQLRPQALSGRSLLVALQAQADALRDRLGLTVAVDAANWRPLAAAVEEELFRIALEALTNLVRHASATGVQIILTTQDGMSVLSVADDGMGFDVSTPRPGHLGLETMAERAERIGARLDIDSTPGQGTRVRVLVPRAKAKPRDTPF